MLKRFEVKAFDGGRLIKELVLDLTADKDKYDWNKDLVENGIVKKALLVNDFEDYYCLMLMGGIKMLTCSYLSYFFEGEQTYRATFDFGKGDTTVYFDMVGHEKGPYIIKGEKEKFEAFLENHNEKLDRNLDDYINLKTDGEKHLHDNIYDLNVSPDDFSRISYKRALRRLVGINLLKNKQMLIFTNQIALMDNELTRPDCCFLVRENEIKALDKCTDKEIRKAHNLEAMYKNGAFD